MYNWTAKCKYANDEDIYSWKQIQTLHKYKAIKNFCRSNHCLFSFNFFEFFKLKMNFKLLLLLVRFAREAEEKIFYYTEINICRANLKFLKNIQSWEILKHHIHDILSLHLSISIIIVNLLVHGAIINGSSQFTIHYSTFILGCSYFIQYQK